MSTFEPQEYAKNENKVSTKVLSPLKNSSYTPEEKDSRLKQIKHIAKYIKSGDVTNLIGGSTQNQSLAPEIDEKTFFDENREAHENLTSLRKKYDDVKGHSLRREMEIQKIRNEIEDSRSLEELVKGNCYQIYQKLENLQNRFDQMKTKLDESLINKKTYEHMLDRMKKDKISHKINSTNMENQLNTEIHSFENKTLQKQKLKQFHLQSQYVLDELMKNIDSEHRNRDEQLNNFKNNVKTRQVAERKRDDRLKRQQEIAEYAAGDHKDSNERKWRKLLLVHKFLNVFLKRKMEREMKKFQVTEQAFQRIKASTGVGDAQEIVNKFLSREETYGQLLISIAEYEKKIERLKKENEELKQQFEHLKNELTSLERPNIKKQTLETEVYKDLINWEERYKKGKVLTEKIYFWTVKMMIKMEKINGSYGDKNFYQTYPKGSLSEAFNKLAEMFDKDLEAFSNMNPEETETINNNLSRSYKLDDTFNDEEYQKRCVRVMLTSTNPRKDNSTIHDTSNRDSSRSNSHNNESEDEEVESEEEDRYLELIRTEMKKESELREKEINKKKKN